LESFSDKKAAEREAQTGQYVAGRVAELAGKDPSTLTASELGTLSLLKHLTSSTKVDPKTGLSVSSATPEFTAAYEESKRNLSGKYGASFSAFEKSKPGEYTGAMERKGKEEEEARQAKYQQDVAADRRARAEKYGFGPAYKTTPAQFKATYGVDYQMGSDTHKKMLDALESGGGANIDMWRGIQGHKDTYGAWANEAEGRAREAGLQADKSQYELDRFRQDPAYDDKK
jgi:hypothetical protein